jgi:hypothetical protein
MALAGDGRHGGWTALGPIIHRVVCLQNGRAAKGRVLNGAPNKQRFHIPPIDEALQLPAHHPTARVCLEDVQVLTGLRRKNCVAFRHCQPNEHA